MAVAMTKASRRTRAKAERRPLFEAVHDRLTTAIAAKTWLPGEKLPSEIDLAAHLGISRPILREVLRELERGGRIIRRHGVGTFVASAPRIETKLPCVVCLEVAAGDASSTIEEVERSIRLTTVGDGAPSPLGLAAGEPMLHIERVKAIAGTRALHLTDYLPAFLISREELEAELATSVVEVVLARAGTETVVVRDVVVAEHADGPTAERLAVPEGTLLMTIEKTVCRPDGTALHAGRAQHVACHFQFTVERQLPMRT